MRFIPAKKIAKEVLLFACTSRFNSIHFSNNYTDICSEKKIKAAKRLCFLHHIAQPFIMPQLHDVK